MADQEKGDDSTIAKSWSSFAVPGTADLSPAEQSSKEAGQTEIADRAVAQRIRQAREATGMPQGQLAYRIGISVEQLDRYERGIDRVRVQDLAAISKACGMPMGAFFAEEEQDEFPSASDGHSRISDELALRLRGALRSAPPGRNVTGSQQRPQPAAGKLPAGQLPAAPSPASPSPGATLPGAAAAVWLSASRGGDSSKPSDPVSSTPRILGTALSTLQSGLPRAPIRAGLCTAPASASSASPGDGDASRRGPA